jgi:membrane protease YdiL (CAAX protease family)
MPPARALMAYLLCVFAGAAILAPWVHHALTAFGVVVPFRRVVNRCLLVIALLGLWPLVKAIGVRSITEIGWKKTPRLWRELARGFALGTILVALAAWGSWISGAFQFLDQSASAWTREIFKALTTAIVVSVLEETLFRGAVYTALRRSWNDHAALWISSAIYGIVHFFARPDDPAVVHWYSGFQTLGGMLRGFADPHLIFPGFLTITLLGIVLALAFKRTGALFLPMGMHASLIFCSKLFAFASDPAPAANRWFWGTEKITDGWFCFMLLLGAAIWYSRRTPRAA